MSNFTLPVLNAMIGETVSVFDPHCAMRFDATISGVRASPMNGQAWEAFITQMQFRQDGYLPRQGMYRLFHPNFGEIELFCSPNSATELEFVVSRKKPTATSES